MLAGVAQEHADLRVLDPARRAGVLPLHPGRLGALLQEAGLVQHQYGSRVGQVLDNVGLQVVPDRIRVPPRPRQELLHPVRRRVARSLGQLPAVLALNRRQQASQVGPRTTARLGTLEPRSNVYCDPWSL